MTRPALETCDRCGWRHAADDMSRRLHQESCSPEAGAAADALAALVPDVTSTKHGYGDGRLAFKLNPEHTVALDVARDGTFRVSHFFWLSRLSQDQAARLIRALRDVLATPTAAPAPGEAGTGEGERGHETHGAQVCGCQCYCGAPDGYCNCAPDPECPDHGTGTRTPSPAKVCTPGCGSVIGRANTPMYCSEACCDAGRPLNPPAGEAGVTSPVIDPPGTRELATLLEALEEFERDAGPFGDKISHALAAYRGVPVPAATVGDRLLTRVKALMASAPTEGTAPVCDGTGKP